MAKIVNSWNEWAPLKRVVIGSAEGAAWPANEPAVHNNGDHGGFGYGYWGKWPQEQIDEACEQQNAFAKTLKNRGVTVDRVAVHKGMKNGDPISTPDWTHVTQRNAANPRDLFLVLGNEIVEAPGTMRQRFYEYLYMRPLFEQYYKEDPEFLWTSAPRPRLTDEDYMPNYWHYMKNTWTPEEKAQRFYQKKGARAENEPLWDAADMIRAGKDIFLHPSSVNNQLGRDWLHRYLASRGFKVHEIRFDGPAIGYYTPWHIDCSLVFAKPGMALYSYTKPILTKDTVELFRKNDWELIPAADPEYPWNDSLSLCGGGAPSNKPTWSSMNVLSVDPKTICADKNEHGYAEQLNKLGFEVIPVAFDKVWRFGGLIHCNTLDIYREGGCEDYFPNQ